MNVDELITKLEAIDLIVEKQYNLLQDRREITNDNSVWTEENEKINNLAEAMDNLWGAITQLKKYKK